MVTKPPVKTAAEKKIDTVDWMNSQGFIQALGDGSGIPGLKKVFDDAIAGQWNLGGAAGQAKFMAAVQAIPWVQANGVWMLDYFKNIAANTDQATGAPNATLIDEREQNAVYVRNRAEALGAVLDEASLAKMVDAVMMHGWTAKNGRTDLLDKALTGQLEWTDGAGKHTYGQDYLNYGKGAAATNIASLKNLAIKNGVYFSDDYFQQAARAINGRMGTMDSYMHDIREHAASSFPIFADKIRAGVDVSLLADPYLSKMADTLELDKNTINLNDSWIKRALTGVDEKGNPKAMGLWDFEKQLRGDSRWQYTKGANDEAGALAHKIISMFGFGG